MPIVQSDWAQISPVQGPTSPYPVTMASGAAISPSTFLTVLTGNTAVTTINPPVTHGHMLAIQFAGTAGVATGGNIQTAKATVVGEVLLLVFNPITQKYIPVG